MNTNPMATFTTRTIQTMSGETRTVTDVAVDYERVRFDARLGAQHPEVPAGYAFSHANFDERGTHVAVFTRFEPVALRAP